MNDTENLNKELESKETPLCESSAGKKNAADGVTPASNGVFFSSADVAAAWIALIMGIVFSRLTLWETYPLALFGMVAAIIVLTCVYLFKSGKVVNPKYSVYAGIILALSLAFFLSSSWLLWCAVLIVCILLYIVWVYGSTRREVAPDSLLFYELIRAMFLQPFSSFGMLFRALFAKRTHGGALRQILTVLGGLALAVVPTIIVLSLLSFDKGFSRLIDGLRFPTLDLGSWILTIILAIPVSMYVFGLLFSCMRSKNAFRMTTEQGFACTRKLGFAPSGLVLGAIVPLLAVYALFFVSQWQYFVSAFTGVLPSQYSLAEYARSGFFELCGVAVINALLCVGLALFSKRREDGKPTTLRCVMTVLLALFTLVLISTALSKLILYVQSYGLTPKRVWAGWLMLLIAVQFILSIVFLRNTRVKVNALRLYVTLGLFAVMALCNVEGLVANYNVAAYLSGNHKEFDLNTMRDLGDPAIPALVRLSVAEDNKEVKQYLKRYQTERGVFHITLPKLRADALLLAVEGRSEDVQWITVRNDCKGEIYGIKLEYYRDGALLSESYMINADNSPLKSDDVLYFDLLPEYADGSLELNGMYLKLSVLGKDGAEWELDEQLSLSNMKENEFFELSVTGSADDGYEVYVAEWE